MGEAARRARLRPMRVATQAMRIGPTQSQHGRELARGSCSQCGGQCAPECGLHPLGCHYGGSPDGYWIIADGCELDHGETDYIR
jgi:hypothetical protein